MRKKKAKRIPRFSPWQRALLIVVAVLLAAAVAVGVADARRVRFYMSGAEEIRVPYGERYEEPGVYAVSVGRLFGESRRRLPVVVRGSVGEELGEYTLRYVTPYLFRLYGTERRVTVVDETPPVLRLHTREGYLPSWLDGYDEEGWEAWDEHDGDLSERVLRRAEGDSFIYTVTDSSGNTASVTRSPQYAVTAPEIRLNGGDHIDVNAGLAFHDPGCTATDSLGNDLTQYVRVEGEVSSFQPGDYELRYSITNALGQTVSTVRTVSVIPIRNPGVIEPDRNTIYLTFDDGPGPYTGRLLDVLAFYNVRATFFVTGLNPDYENQIGRAWREGHSIGVHSATHDYYSIYASEEAFFADFNAVEDIILRQTGTTTRLFRFPGGSSNTVSRFNPGVMTRLTRAMTDMGYIYFDWNVDSNDAGGTRDTESILRNLKDGCTGRRVSVVLQHDIKDYSVDAVESFIVWALNNGYQFAPLTESSPRAQHGVNN